MQANSPKNKIKQSKFEDLIDFIKCVMNPSASHLPTGRALCNVEGFYREKGGSKGSQQNKGNNYF